MDHSFTFKLHHTCLYLVSVHQTATPLIVVADIYLHNTTRLSTPKARKAELAWLTYSGQFTHLNGRPSAVGRAQDRKSSPVKDRRSTAVSRNQTRLGAPRVSPRR